MSSLIHDIKHTFFGVKPKLSNIKGALIVFSGPPFELAGRRGSQNISDHRDWKSVARGLYQFS
jgi:hypothetical protein